MPAARDREHTIRAFLAEAHAPLAISSSSVTEIHCALGLKLRTGALSPAQAEAVLQGFAPSLAPGPLVLELELQDFRNANACLRCWSTTLPAAVARPFAAWTGSKPLRDSLLRWRAAHACLAAHMCLAKPDSTRTHRSVGRGDGRGPGP
jgi:hypothetical protein